MSLSHAVEEIQTTKCEIEAQGDSVANEIKSLFAEYRKVVDKHEQKLLKEAAMKMTDKLTDKTLFRRRACPLSVQLSRV